MRVEQCGGTVMEELGGGTGELIVEQCGKTVLVEQCGGTVEQCWCNSVVEQCDSEGGTVEQ